MGRQKYYIININFKALLEGMLLGGNDGPYTASELDIDTIKKMVDEHIDAHGNYLPKFN